MFITMLVVMVMGDIVVQTQAQNTINFGVCFPGCVTGCATEKFPKLLLCPITCLGACLLPPLILAKEIDRIDYYCKLGSATHHCISLYSLRNPNKFFFSFFIRTILVCSTQIHFLS